MSRHKSRNNKRQNTELTDREIKILSMRYLEDMTLRDIGESFDFTHTRARQVINNALIKIGLKNYLHEKRVDVSNERV